MDYRWNIYLVNLDPVIGSEQGKTRPVLVISDDDINAILPVINSLPITSYKQGRKIKNANRGSPDEVRARLKSGGHLDDNKNMSGMLDRAAENERRLIYDNHGKNLIHSLDAAVDLVHSVDKSTDKPYGSDSKPKHNNTSDNDLPPIPKE